MKEAIERMQEIAYLAKKHEWDNDVTVKIQLSHVFAILDFYEHHKAKIKPEAIEWPDGAEYLATDENGVQCFYGFFPFINEETKEWSQSVSGFFDYRECKCENWRESLIKRPVKQ